MIWDKMVGWNHDSMDISLSKLWEWVIDRENSHAEDPVVKRFGYDRVSELN